MCVKRNRAPTRLPKSPRDILARKSTEQTGGDDLGEPLADRLHYHQGCDGVVDISPFTCMNGIVTEAVCPRVSADHDHMPIRNFFFDGTQSDLDRDVAIFVELARAYQAPKKTTRIYPSVFPQ